MSNRELLAQLNGLLDELYMRLVNYEEARGESQDLDDEGIVLAARSHKMLDAAMLHSGSVRRKIEAVDWSHVDA